MSLRAANFWLACMGMACALPAAGQAPPPDSSLPKRNESIEFSAPRGDTLVTNVDQLAEQAKRALDGAPNASSRQPFTSSQDSLEGVLALPAPSAGTVVKRRSKSSWDSLDTPDASLSSSSPEDLMRDVLFKQLLSSTGADKDRDSRNLKQPSTGSIQSLYEQMLGFGDSSSGGQEYGSYSPVKTGRPETEKKRDSGIEESKSAWRDQDVSKDYLEALQSSRLTVPGAAANDLWNPSSSSFDARAYQMSPEGVRAKEAQEQQLKQFQNLLDGIDGSPPANAGGSSAAANPWKTGAAAEAPEVEERSPFAVPQPGLNPALLAPTAPVAPVPTSLSPIPYVPPARPVPKPTFTIPQRAF